MRYYVTQIEIPQKDSLLTLKNAIRWDICQVGETYRPKGNGASFCERQEMRTIGQRKRQL